MGVTAKEVSDYIDELILSDGVTGPQSEILKKARRIINSVDKYNLVDKEPKKKQGGASENPFKRKSSGKMGKRCIHCNHFEKYGKDEMRLGKYGVCHFFGIEVQDTFNGCSQQDGNVQLHNFDPEEVAKLKSRTVF